jgi:hypothetical protein
MLLVTEMKGDSLIEKARLGNPSHFGILLD